MRKPRPEHPYRGCQRGSIRLRPAAAAGPASCSAGSLTGQQFLIGNHPFIGAIYPDVFQHALIAILIDDAIGIPSPSHDRLTKPHSMMSGPLHTLPSDS